MKMLDARIAIVGLGYVGLPLAVEFGKTRPVIGFDINHTRVTELLAGHDSTLEVTDEELQNASRLVYSTDIESLKEANVYIVTVPTPIDESNLPDLSPLRESSEMLSKVIDKGDVVIFESTVYPGATEEVCIPIIEKGSFLKFNVDFFAAYSPERINPGDKINTLTKIKKITSGSTPEVADFVDSLYGSIIEAGTHKASSIKVAEAAKVIENVQRDVNIALVNELSQICNSLGINTSDVLNAAGTKWNFMKLKPGLVGGHCIGVDPYYLMHRSQLSGYIPDLIRTAREINDHMPNYVANEFLSNLIRRKINPVDCRVALLGFTFKENCPDVRNTKVFDLYLRLSDLGLNVKVYDPWVNKNEAVKEYGLEICSDLSKITEDVAVLAVGHDEFVGNLDSFNFEYIYDFKGTLD